MDIKDYELAKKLYLQGMSLTAIQKKTGIERHRLSHRLKQDNIQIIQNGQKHAYNEKFFKVIDTERKAYWLGFLYADGNVVNYGNYEVKISLAYKDLNHLKEFEKDILLNENDTIVYSYTAKIKEKEYPSAKLIVSNKTIVEQLIDLGCIPNKSLTITFPDESIVPKHLIRHFIRGYFDGDGSVSPIKYEPNRKANSYRSGNVCISFVGTDGFLTSLVNIFKDVCTDLGKIKIYQKKTNKHFSFLKQSMEQIKKFLSIFTKMQLFILKENITDLLIYMDYYSIALWRLR